MSRDGKTRIPASNSARAAGSGQRPRGSGLDRRALAAVSVTVVAWASAFVAIRGAGRYFDPGALALGRRGDLAQMHAAGARRSRSGRAGHRRAEQRS